MIEHRIRLRGGWGCCAAGLPDSDEQRVTLPIRWSPDGLGRMRLTRRFGRPPFDPDRELLILRLDQVAGIRCILLNGQPIAGVAPEKSLYELQIDHSRDRNLLVLEIERPLPCMESAGASAEWGIVALVVRPIEPAAGSATLSP
ncbi:MAG: hypothetical protein ACHRXM_02315 [Isosphaerales bacterium]